MMKNITIIGLLNHPMKIEKVAMDEMVKKFKPEEFDGLKKIS